MTKKLLTQKDLAALAPRDKPYVVPVVGRLRLRVAKDGTKTWQVRLNIKGQELTKTFDEPFGDGPGQLTLKVAAMRAEVLLSQARMGVDQMAEDKAEVKRQAAINPDTATVHDVFEAWFPTIAGKHGRKGHKDGGDYAKGQYDRHIKPYLGATTLRTLIAADVRRAISKPSRNRNQRTTVVVFRQFMQMMRWAEKNLPFRPMLFETDIFGMRVDEVIVGKYDPVKDNQRERWLPADEIKMLPGILSKSSLPVYLHHAVWLILATGVRVEEISEAQRGDIDVKNRRWHIPETKGDKEHNIYLSDFAIRHIEALFKMYPGAKYLIPQKRTYARIGVAEKHLHVKTLTKQLGYRQQPEGTERKPGRPRDMQSLVLPGGYWASHDLRRSCTSNMQAIGINEKIGHRILNHTAAAQESNLDPVYMQYGYDKEMRDAWARWGQELDRLTAQKRLRQKLAVVA